MFSTNTQRLITSNESDLNMSLIAGYHRALMIDLILEKIFGFLELKDLKKCRLICHKWKCVVDASFKKKVRICFDFEEELEELACSKYPAPDDLSEFFKFANDEYSFVAIRLANSASWTTAEIIAFFSDEGQFITDLIFCDVILKTDKTNDDESSFYESYNLSELIGCVENLKSLKIHYKKPKGKGTAKPAKFGLSLQDLKNVPRIHLEYCTIELTQDTKIFPIELHLMSNQYKRNNEPLDNLILNDFVDLSNVKKLSVDIKVDMLGNFNLNSLLFFNVDLLHFEESNWNVESLEFYAVPFVTETKMKFTEFSISAAEFDLRCLPKSVNELMIGADCRIIEGMPWSINLPNIKNLTLESDAATKLILPHIISSFTNLTELSFRSPLGNIVHIDVNLVPKEVKVVNFFGNEFDFCGDSVVILDILNVVFSDHLDYDYLRKITNCFAPEHLKIFVRFPSYNADIRCLKQIINNNMAIPKITIGPIFIQDRENEETVIDSVEITKEGFTCSDGGIINQAMKDILYKLML